MDQVVALLQALDLAKQWPNLKGVHDLAMSDLLKLNETALVELDKRAKEAAAKQAEIDAKIAAEAAARKAKADAEAETQARAADEAWARTRAQSRAAIPSAEMDEAARRRAADAQRSIPEPARTA